MSTDRALHWRCPTCHANGTINIDGPDIQGIVENILPAVARSHHEQCERIKRRLRQRYATCDTLSTEMELSYEGSIDAKGWLAAFGSAAPPTPAPTLEQLSAEYHKQQHSEPELEVVPPVSEHVLDELCRGCEYFGGNGWCMSTCDCVYGTPQERPKEDNDAPVYVAEVYVDWAVTRVMCVSHDLEQAKAATFRENGQSWSSFRGPATVETWQGGRCVDRVSYVGGEWRQRCCGMNKGVRRTVMPGKSAL